MNYHKINGEHFYNMMVNACNKLEEQKDFVNSLNVFPVPDGDTGTNMSMTLRSAVEEIRGIESKAIGIVSKKLARGALMGARGNSGVILSQILRGIAKGLEDKDEVDASEFSECFMEGSRAAYKAVMRPTEGTILTIIKAAGESAINSACDDITKLMEEICDHSKDVLNRTPEMLPVLKQAKVVDAGGMGLLVILNGMKEGLMEGEKIKIQQFSDVEIRDYALGELKEEEIRFGYCTEFIILTDSKNVNAFRDDVEKHGDSLIVVRDEDIVKVHIHTNDPGLVLSEAVKLGELSKIKIENMREQHRHLIYDDSSYVEGVKKEEPAKDYGMISVAMGDGLVNIFKDLGVDYVIEGGQTMNPSTQDILDCIDKINAKNIIVFPNNKNIIMAASQAAELSNKNIVVIPSKTIPQGITAVTMFNSEISIEENKSVMLDSIEKVISASVTYAVRDTEMDGKDIKEGNILGLLEGKINEVGNDPYAVCENLVDSMIKEDSELITVFYGRDCDETKVREMISKLEIKYKHMDVQIYKGDQPLYYFILAVE